MSETTSGRLSNKEENGRRDKVPNGKRQNGKKSGWKKQAD